MENRDEEVENARRLDKLPKEVWERIFDELDENDLFPLALSCRFFREKQKELVARTRQQGPWSGKPRLALKTNLWPRKNQPASADYRRFCSKEKAPRRSSYLMGHKEMVRHLAAYHGHLPLLQEQLGTFKNKVGMPSDFIGDAGESSFAQSRLLLLVRFGF